MKITIDFERFAGVFQMRGEDNKFSREGCRVIYEWLIDLERKNAEELEFKSEEIFKTFEEYKNIEAFRKHYGQGFESIEDIAGATTLIPIDDQAFVIKKF